MGQHDDGLDVLIQTSVHVNCCLLDSVISKSNLLSEGEVEKYMLIIQCQNPDKTLWNQWCRKRIPVKVQINQIVIPIKYAYTHPLSFKNLNSMHYWRYRLWLFLKQLRSESTKHVVEDHDFREQGKFSGMKADDTISLKLPWEAISIYGLNLLLLVLSLLCQSRKERRSPQLCQLCLGYVLDHIERNDTSGTPNKCYL